jgi:hypothetical protein
MYWYSVPRRIWEYNPDMKLIIILRNPVTRAFSHWNMERVRKREPLPFSAALEVEPQRAKATLPFQDRCYSYVDRGFYTEQIRRIWHYFPKEQTLFLKTEELRNELQATLGKIFDFLQIERIKAPQVIKKHVMPYTTALSDKDKDFLKHIYEFEIKELERLLRWDCSGWLDC